MNSIKTFFNDLTCENKVLDSCYSVEYEYYRDNGLYIYKLTCDNYWPTVGCSKYFIEARMIAYKLMLFNINHNIMYDGKIEDEEKPCKLNEALKNGKAIEEEKEVEEFELSDSYLYTGDFNWDYMPDDKKKELLNKELDEYHDPNKEESDLERENLPCLRVPIAEDSPPVFGRPMIFKKNDLSFNYQF
jgi:hypothetical protein